MRDSLSLRRSTKPFRSVLYVSSLSQSQQALERVDHVRLLELAKVGNEFGNDGHRTVSRGLIFGDETLG